MPPAASGVDDRTTNIKDSPSQRTTSPPLPRCSLPPTPSSASLVFQPPHVFQRPPEGKFDLPIETPQLIIGPALHGLKHLRIEPQEIWFAIRHSLLVDSSRVDHRLGCLFAAEHHQQVRDHRGFPLRVEFDDLV